MKRKYTIYGMMALVVLAFSSCQLGKHYARPELNLPQQLDSTEQDTLSIADRQWWELYTDTTLQALIERTLEYNKDMKIAAARVKELAAMKRIDFANLFPQVSGKLYADKEAENYGGDNYDSDRSYEAKAIVSWEVDLWGNLRWAKDKSMADFLGSIEAQRALKMSLVAEVAQAYFELVALDNELAIVRQTLNARKEGVRLAKLRFEGGLTSETSYQQAQVELARTATLVPDLERKISIKENDIAFLAGEFPTRIERSRFLQELDVPESLPVGLPSDLLERRPDIRAAEQQLIAEHARVKVAYTNMFPRISLTGQFGLESDVLSNFLQSPYSLLNGAVLTPLFNWGKNRAALKAQKASFEAEVHSYEKSVLNAFKEAKNAIVDFNKIKEVYQLCLKLERSAKTYVDLAQLQYINGVINYMDVLDAQRGYFDAQIGVSNAIRDELIAVVNVYKALGGGWQIEE